MVCDAQASLGGSNEWQHPLVFQRRRCGENGFSAKTFICSTRRAGAGCVHRTGNAFTQRFVRLEPASPFWSLFFFSLSPSLQLVLLKYRKKVFTLDNLGYEAQFGMIHPEGTTVAVGGDVSGRTDGSYNKMSYFCRNHSSFLFSCRIIWSICTPSTATPWRTRAKPSTLNHR